MSAAPLSLPRARAVASVGALAPVAVSCRSLPPMQTCAHLDRLADACREAAAPYLDAAEQRVRILAEQAEAPRTQAATALHFAEEASLANRLVLGAQLLAFLARDEAFHRFAAEQVARHAVSAIADGAFAVFVQGEVPALRPDPAQDAHPLGTHRADAHARSA